MLALVVFVDKKLRRRLYIRIDLFCMQRHLCARFHNDGMIGGFIGVGSPTKDAMVSDEATWNREGVEVFLGKTINDNVACLCLIGAFNLGLGKRAHAGNVAIEIIGLRGAVTRNRFSRLRPRGRPR